MDNISQSPQLVVAGRFLTGQEEERWQRVLRDPISDLLRVVLIILLAFFSIQAAALSAEKDWRLPSVVVPLIAACIWCLIVCAQQSRRRRRQAFENAWLDRWQDANMIRAGCMISLYDVHAAHSTMRGSSMLRYTEVTHFCETADGIAIGNERFTICFRSADMTGTELTAIRRFLQEQVTASKYSLKAPAVPALSEPLAHVRFANYDTIITRAAVLPTANKREFSELVGVILPQMIIYSLVPALMIALTPWPLINCLIFGVIFSLFGVLITYLMVGLKKKKQDPVRLVFTKDGIAKQQEGVVTFMVRGRYFVRKTESGVTVVFTNGEQIEIPWESVEDPDAFKREFA